MRGKTVYIGIVAAALLALVSCTKGKLQPNSPMIGHWGCEQYVSCRTDSLGLEQWDTLRFEAVIGGEYEIFFNADGTGLLKLNNSPAFIKEFSCKYEYDSVAQTVTVESSTWLLMLFGSLFNGVTTGVFDTERITDTEIVASWTNYLSEPQPFFERFFLKRIDEEDGHSDRHGTAGREARTLGPFGFERLNNYLTLN